MADEIFARTSRLATNLTYNITKDKNFVNQLQINPIKLLAVLDSFRTMKIAKSTYVGVNRCQISLLLDSKYF